jgi:predicted component of type VI protein secretion system
MREAAMVVRPMQIDELERGCLVFERRSGGIMAAFREMANS